MKKTLTLMVCLIAGAFLMAQNPVQSLREALLADTPLEEDLQELCDNIGGRVTGAEANAAAVNWALSKFEKAGLKAWKQEFEMPVLWLDKATTGRISGGIRFEPLLVAKYQSPPGTYEGDLVYVEEVSAAAFEAQAATIKDQFVLVASDLCLDINGLFAEYGMAATAEELARKYGAKGIVFMSSRPNKLLYRFIASKTTENDLPQLVMAREDAQRCIRSIEKGEKLTIAVRIEAKTGGAFKTHNVIAEIPGSEKPEEVVIIGAHIDSWALGTGANDNGCNVSLMIDIARQMTKLGIQPKRTLRIALWNGEEQGYFGSWAYTQAYEQQMDQHVMALSVDIGSGDIIGFFTNGVEALVPVVDQVLGSVSDLGSFAQINAPIVGTDNFDFMLQGVGNLVANHKPAFYGPNYHAASDTYDKVDLEALKRNSAIVGALALGFANLDEQDITWKRQTRPEIQAMFEQFQLEFTMRMFSVWEPWLGGERGRK